MAVFYTNMDMLKYYPAACERETMLKIAASKEDCVALDSGCPVASWAMDKECEKSENAAQLLEYYNITPRKINFHYPEKK